MTVKLERWGSRSSNALHYTIITINDGNGFLDQVK